MPDGTVSEELLVSFAAQDGRSVLVIPPLFDEHNKLRRQLVEVMRRLGEAGIGSHLPDLPGWNESLRPLETQTIAFWRDAIVQAAKSLKCSHFLAVRSGALLAPEKMNGWLYAPQSGAKLLRGMIRARIIASKEAGSPESSEELYERGRKEGLLLSGWSISAEMFREIESAQADQSDTHNLIEQSHVGGAGLWLRAEPDEDADQADTLATTIIEDLAKPG